MSGSPSEFLFSSRTSRLVMRVCLRLRRITTKRSIAASTRPTAMAVCSSAAVPSAAVPRSRETECAPLAVSTGMSPEMTTHRARAIAAVFSSAFAPSHSACRPNTRRTPETRLNCS